MQHVVPKKMFTASRCLNGENMTNFTNQIILGSSAPLR